MTPQHGGAPRARPAHRDTTTPPRAGYRVTLPGVVTVIALAALLIPLPGCGTDGAKDPAPGHPGAAGKAGHGPPSAGEGRPWENPSAGAAASVPVEVATVVRRSISSYIETNGTLEAENEVDVVARTAGPIVALEVEEGDFVRSGQVLARLDDREHRAELEVARVNLNEMRLAFERAKTLQAESLISPEVYEQAQSDFETAQAQMESSQIQLDYTQIKAPFDGLIVRRYVNFAQQVSANTALFRISDFDPLLCPIQVPERELSSLRKGQRAYLTVEPFPGERFDADVLRISPVVSAATGTIKVTLEVSTRRKLRPGMFARVFLETATRPDALVIPKAALSLESIGDTIYVADGAVASRREVELGFSEGDFVQIVSGVKEGESVVVVGQDGLSDGTPIQVLRADGQDTQSDSAATQSAPPGPARGPEGRPDFSSMTPEQLEQVKQRMRARGMSEEQIEERLSQARQRAGGS